MKTKNDLIIRQARRQDARDVLVMVRQLAKLEGGDCLFKTSDFLTEGFGSRRSFTTLIAFYKSNPVGYLSFHPGYDMESASKGFYLIDFFVKQRYRKKKIGTALMYAVLKMSKQSGRKWISWHVNRTNRIPIAFYERLGASRTNSLQYVLKV